MKAFSRLLLVSTLGISVFSCIRPGPDTARNARIDSLITSLRLAKDNYPDSVLSESRKLADSSLPDTLEAKLALLTADIYQLKGEYDSAIAIATKGIGLAGKNNRLLARLYKQAGIDYDYKSDYRQALINYQKAQQYFDAVHDSAGFINIKNNIGLLYQNTGDFKRAKEYFLECLKLGRDQHLHNEQVIALSNLGSIENELHNFSTALSYFKEVLAADLASGNGNYIASSYHNVGEAYKNLRQFDSGVYYFIKAIALKEKLSPGDALVNSYKAYADLLIETNKPAEAQHYLEKSFRLVRETGNIDYLKDCFYLQARLAEKKGDFKTAYIANDSFYILKDSIAGAKFRTELVAKEKDNEYMLSEELQQRQIDELESEKVTFILFMIFFAAVSASLLLLLKKQRSITRQLKLQKQQIEDGLAQRSHLLSFIAHEIRNPLGGIMGLTDLMLNNRPTETQKELLVYQKKASAHLLSLMNDVLEYQKLGSGKVELNSIRFNLKDVLYQVYGLYQVDIREKKLVYELSYDKTIPDVLMGDPVRLTQVFSNLLNNAIKFTDKGKVAISVQLQVKTPVEVLVDCKVADSGIGIPKEDQEKIFELYVQSSTNKAAQLGTGLGLSIVRNLLHLMNSRIEMESTPGQGTTFSFTIPFSLPE
jgi:signal transduction histidine kinase